MLRRIIMASLASVSLLIAAPIWQVVAQNASIPFVLVVEVEVVPSELENFIAATKENGEAAVRDESGCRQFNIVFEKDNPNRIMLFEVYDNAEAYEAHQATEHFKKYLATTANMVKSRKRMAMVAVALNAKSH
jgi:quinol monooxygenase YgiN